MTINQLDIALVVVSYLEIIYIYQSLINPRGAIQSTPTPIVTSVG